MNGSKTTGIPDLFHGVARATAEHGRATIAGAYSRFVAYACDRAERRGPAFADGDVTARGLRDRRPVVLLCAQDLHVKLPPAAIQGLWSLDGAGAQL